MQFFKDLFRMRRMEIASDVLYKVWLCVCERLQNKQLIDSSSFKRVNSLEVSVISMMVKKRCVLEWKPL